MGFTFNGISKSYIELLSLSMNRLAPLNRQLLEVPGLPGAHLSRTKTEVRKISMLIDIQAISYEALLLRIEELNEWLVHEDPKELIFDDEPLRKYYAVLEGSIDDSLLSTYGQLSLNFICPDPYKYGPEVTNDFIGGFATFQNGGSVKASPIIEATVLSDITYLDVYNDEGYMRIGRPVDLGQTSVQREQRVLWDQMSSLVGWTTAASAEGDSILGAFSTNGYEFSATYGTAAGIWHGPSLKKSIPNAPLTDFKVEFSFKFPSVTKQYGRLELFLLDDQSQVVGKMAMKRLATFSNANTVEVRIGDNVTNFMFVEQSGTNRAWEDFDGMIRLSRQGNVWEVYVAKVNPSTKVHSARLSKQYVDSGNVYVRNLSQVQIHAAQYGSQSISNMKITDLKVFKLNNVSQSAPHVIAGAGDVIRFDHKKSLITINGEDKKILKDFGASFFKLPKGTNILIIDPEESVTATVTIEEAYL